MVGHHSSWGKRKIPTFAFYFSLITQESPQQFEGELLKEKRGLSNFFT
jgi:hypothetical protein